MIVALVVAGVSWFGRPTAGTLHVTTDPADAVVTVDGTRTSGSTSPFLASDLAAEVEHEVVVSRVGYQTWRTHLRLRSGQVLALPMVTLAPNAVARLSNAPPTIAPRPASKPAAAAAAPASAQPAANHAPGEAHPSVAARRRAPLRSSSNRARRTSKPAHERPQPPSGAGAAAKPEQGSASAVAAATGTLRINSRPWSRVYVDGRLVGNTPQTQLVVNAGWHTVTLVNPDFGLQKVLTIRVKPGEVATKVVELGPR